MSKADKNAVKKKTIPAELLQLYELNHRLCKERIVWNDAYRFLTGGPWYREMQLAKLADEYGIPVEDRTFIRPQFRTLALIEAYFEKRFTIINQLPGHGSIKIHSITDNLAHRYVVPKLVATLKYGKRLTYPASTSIMEPKRVFLYVDNKIVKTDLDSFDINERSEVDIALERIKNKIWRRYNT